MKTHYDGIICRGSYLLGTECGHCEKCKDERDALLYGKFGDPSSDHYCQIVEPDFVIVLKIKNDEICGIDWSTMKQEKTAEETIRKVKDIVVDSLVYLNKRS